MKGFLRGRAALLVCSVVAIGVVLAALFQNSNDTRETEAAESRSAERSPSRILPSLMPRPDAEPDGGLRLSGRVVGSDGRGLAGADVWIDSVPRRSERTELDGTFAFERLVGRTYAVGARRGELIGGPHPVRLTERSEPVVIRLREGAHLQVTVANAANAPIANAELHVLADGTVATTDANGEATLTAIPGWIEIEASAQDYAPRRITTAVGSPGATGRMTIVLQEGFPVAGRVVDEHGAEIADARVFALQPGSSFEDDAKTFATTDRDGVFTFDALAGTHAFVAIDGEHAPAMTLELGIDRAITGIEIAMKPGAVYAGSVVDVHGTPVPQARVHVDVRDSLTSRQVTTDADGAFEITGLPRTGCVAYAESDAGVSKEASIDLIDHPEVRGHKLVLELVVGPESHIAGTVVDDTGAPVAGVTVNAKLREQEVVRSSASTDARGTFSIADLPRGEYALWAGDSDRQRPPEEVTVAHTGDKGVRIALSRTGAIKGKVVLAETSTPPTWFSVGLASTYVHRDPTPAEHGVFEIRDLTPSVFTLTFRGPELVDTTQANVQVEPGKTTDVGTITVQRGRRVTGTVVDSAGRPVAGAKVMLGYGHTMGNPTSDERLFFFGRPPVVTDPSGAFSVLGVSAKTNLGATQLVAGAEHPLHGRSLPIGIPQGAGDPPPITITLRGCGSITGTVTQNGKPVRDALIGAGWPELAVTRTTEDGAFGLSRLPEGTIELRTMLPTESLRAHQTSVRVVAGKQTNVTIDVPVGTVTLVVTVRSRAGHQVTAATMFLLAGTVKAETYKQVMAPQFTGLRDLGRWLGDGSAPSRFDRLVPGDHTLCTIPLAGDPADSAFMQRVRDHGDAVKAYCVPVRVGAMPAEQAITVEVPSMVPLPAPD